MFLKQIYRLHISLLIANFFVLSLCSAQESENSSSSLVFVKDVPTEHQTHNSAAASNGVDIDGDEEAATELFIPSNVWQKVKPGQVLPAGLHYRINLQSGLKEAKLLDDNEHSSSGISSESSNSDSLESGKSDSFAHSEQGQGWVDQNGKFNYLSEDDLKRRLASLPDSGPQNDSPPDLSQYRTAEELKKDYEELRQQFRTETEMVESIIESLKHQPLEYMDISVLLTHLEDLDFYMHQIDNAENFMMKMDGLSLIKSFLNHSHISVKQAGLKVLTACLQSHQKLKVFAIEKGSVLNLLTQILTNPETDPVLVRTAFFSLSALLRNFPFAQQLFGDINGFDTLCRLVTNQVLSPFKVLQLETDLMLESDWVKLDESDDSKQSSNNSFLLMQYKLAAVSSRVQCTCALITENLTTKSNVSSNLKNFEVLVDSIEYFVRKKLCDSDVVLKWERALTEVLTTWFANRETAPKEVLDQDLVEYKDEIFSKLERVVAYMKNVNNHDEL